MIARLYLQVPDINGRFLNLFTLFAIIASNPIFNILIQYLSLEYFKISVGVEFNLSDSFIIFLILKYLDIDRTKSFPVPHGITTISEEVLTIPEATSFNVPSPPST